MKCSVCGQEASFSKPKYRGAKNKTIEIQEYRCNEHVNLGRRIERKINYAISNEKFDAEIKKLFSKYYISEIYEVVEPIISEPSVKSKPSE